MKAIIKEYLSPRCVIITCEDPRFISEFGEFYRVSPNQVWKAISTISAWAEDLYQETVEFITRGEK